MTTPTLALKSASVFIAIALPFAIVSCASDDTPSNQSGGTGGGTTMGGSGGSSAAGAGQTGKGGSSGSGTAMGGGSGTGGSSASGGSGGAGAAGKGGAGAGGAGAGGSAGKGTAGGGGMPGGGAGGAATGGMGGAATGGMAGTATGGMAGANGAGAGGSGGGGAFTLTSPTHEDGAHFDAKFTCAAMNGTFGAGVNPELNWTGVPAGTKSLAMTFIDTTLGEDSSMGQHWAIWNIPWDGTKPTTMPEGMGQTLTGDFAMAKQNGKFLTPCAQSLMGGMDDEYRFKLYALSTETLNVTGSTSVANALTALRAAEAQTLGTAELTGHAGLKGE
jgi:phosphatidylethanolamine-binding protein (PEBP) family uncharacterized protein